VIDCAKADQTRLQFVQERDEVRHLTQRRVVSASYGATSVSTPRARYAAPRLLLAMATLVLDRNEAMKLQTPPFEVFTS